MTLPPPPPIELDDERDDSRIRHLFDHAMVLTERAIYTGTDRDDRAAQAAYEAWRRAKGETR